MQKKAFSVEDNIIKEMTKPGNYGRNRFGGIGAGVISYPYEKIADYVSYDLAIDSIGGTGDATKWTKYDKKVEAYKAEQKKRGVPMLLKIYNDFDEFLKRIDGVTPPSEDDARNIELARETIINTCM